MTSGEIRFGYTVSVTGAPGVVVGNTATVSNLLPGSIINLTYQNNSDILQSVYYSITPKVNNGICVPGNIVVSEVKVHQKTIQYNYAGTNGDGILITKTLTCDGGS